MQGTLVLRGGQCTTRPVPFTKFSLLQATSGDEQLVTEQRPPAALTGMVSWEQSMVPRQVGAVASPTKSWHAVLESSRIPLNLNALKIKGHFS